MNTSEYNNNDYDNVQLPRQQIQTQLPDHLKCGEVFTWLCEGELYAVECKLCEDRPMCPLSEFPQHMEIWHTDWGEESGGGDNDKDSQGDNEDLYDDYDDEDQQFDDEDRHLNEVNDDDLQLSFTTEDSGLYEDDEIEDHLFLIAPAQVVEEFLEPFEQVLIEHDNNVDSTQINEHEDEDEEKTEEYNKKLARTTKGKHVNDQQHKPDSKLQQFNINNSIKENCKTKEQLREYGNLITESKKTQDQTKYQRANARELKHNGNITENKRDRENYLENDLETENCCKNTGKTGNFETKDGKITPRKRRQNNRYSSKNALEDELSKEFETSATESQRELRDDELRAENLRDQENYLENFEKKEGKLTPRKRMQNNRDYSKNVLEDDLSKEYETSATESQRQIRDNEFGDENLRNQENVLDQKNCCKKTEELEKFEKKEGKITPRKRSQNNTDSSKNVLEEDLSKEFETSATESQRELRDDEFRTEILRGQENVLEHCSKKTEKSGNSEKKKGKITPRKRKTDNRDSLKNVLKDFLKEVETSATELRDDEFRADKLRDQENDLEHKNCSKKKEKLGNSANKEEKITPRRRKTGNRDSLKNDLKDFHSKEFKTSIAESQNQELIKNSKSENYSLSSLNKAKVFLRKSNRNLNEISFEEKHKSNNESADLNLETLEDFEKSIDSTHKLENSNDSTDNQVKKSRSSLRAKQNLKTLEDFEKSMISKNNLSRNLENSNDPQENSTNNSKSIISGKKSKTRDSEALDNLKDSNESIGDLEQTLFNNVIENLDNFETIREFFLMKGDPSAKIQKENTSESQEKEKLLNDKLKIINQASFSEILTKNRNKSQNSTKTYTKSKTLSLRDFKRKTSSENDSEQSLFSKEEEIENSPEVSTTNRKESQKSTKTNKKSKTLSLRGIKRKMSSGNDLEQSLFSKEEENENPHEVLTTNRELPLRAFKRKISLENDLEQSLFSKEEENENPHEVLTTNCDESQNSTKSNTKSKTHSVRIIKRRSSSENDLETSLFTNEEENENLSDILKTNPEKSKNFLKSVTKSKTLSLRAVKRSSSSETDLEQSLLTNKEGNAEQQLKENSKSQNSTKRSKKRTSKVKVPNRNKNLCVLEKSVMTNDAESISDIEEMLRKNSKESRNKNKRNRSTLSLRAKCRKAKLADTQHEENTSPLEKLVLTKEEGTLMGKKALTEELKEGAGILRDQSIEASNGNKDYKEASELSSTPHTACMTALPTFATLKESCLKKRKAFLRKLREKSAYIKNLRKSSESSLDLEKTLSALTVDNLKSKELELLKATQENLRKSENFSELEKNSFTDSSTPATMDIYDLLSLNSLKTSCYVTESSTYYSPASLTSDEVSLSFKQNLNNLFETSTTFQDQNLKPLTPPSPKTEEEHFEFYEPKEKLTKHHILKLIELYKEHPRLWNHSHPEFCDSQLSRLSWQDLTDKWNEYCQRKFTMAEVRIRICTLCQRYLKARERLELEGELDEGCKFSYYEEMKFLEQQKSLQKRRELYEQQNEKVIEIYQHFPVLWHVGCHNLRQAAERTRALQSISTALKVCGIHLSVLEVQKRIRSLRKFYRLDKIRYLHCQVEQTPFEGQFKHFERMQFLDKHIDPFVCRICGKIFENFVGYREHLDTENHGSILEEDSASESENEFEEGFQDVNDIIEYDETVTTPPNELETLTPHSEETLTTETSAYSETVLTYIPYTNEVTLSTTSPLINEVLIYPDTSAKEAISNNLQSEDQIFEEILENVAYNDSFTTQSLDNFMNTVNSCENINLNNCINSETLPSNIMNIRYSDMRVDNEIVIDQTYDKEITNHNDPCNIVVNLNSKNENQEIPNQTDQTKLMENYNYINENQDLANPITENNSPSPLVVNVQCADYSVDLQLNTEKETSIMSANPDDPEIDAAEMDGIFSRLPPDDIRKMIVLYHKYPQLWNPNHLDYNSRNLRRLAWCNLTAEYCKILGRQISWRTIHRKLTDLAKYYKKLLMEQKNCEEAEIKWAFYKDFKFLDDVIAVHSELQRSVHHRDNNFKIIGIYKYLPQLWDIKHPDYNKRPAKQRNIEQMCYRLQEEYNLQLTPERLKNRLIELRAQYRATKKQRLKALKNQQTFTPEFEFYEALLFIDPHIDPFICDLCDEEFKKLTEFNQHRRKEHETKKVLRHTPLSLTDHRAGNDHLLQNVCHICGIKFTTKSNLVHHLRRHDGIKNYECTLCTKKFFSSHSLKIHIRSHTKECPYTCEKCGASFVCASKLNQHVKRHTNKKDFQCDYCPKAFFTAFEMDRHVRRHLNIRDKICPICNKSFVVGSSYYAHMMLHNDTKRFVCNYCDMKFAQYAGLYKHKKRHH